MITTMNLRLLTVFGSMWFSAHVAANLFQPDVLIEPDNTHVVVNIPQTRLFFHKGGDFVKTFPVAAGKISTQTPLGEYRLGGIAKNPVWHVPLSIQAEMKKTGLEPKTTVPTGPNNPLGPVFIRFGDPSLGLGMHGTSAPESVPGLRSHGCVRLKSPDALTMAKLVETKKTRVSVIYQTTLLNTDEAGQLWLLKLADGYKKKPNVAKQYAQALSNYEAENGVQLNQKRVAQAQKLAVNLPFCLSCTSDKTKIKGTLTSVKWLSTDVMPPITSPKEKISPQVIVPQAPTVPKETPEPILQIPPMETPPTDIKPMEIPATDAQLESNFLPKNLDEADIGEIEALP
jgi:hypothetical protein